MHKVWIRVNESYLEFSLSLYIYSQYITHWIGNWIRREVAFHANCFVKWFSTRKLRNRKDTRRRMNKYKLRRRLVTLLFFRLTRAARENLARFGTHALREKIVYLKFNSIPGDCVVPNAESCFVGSCACRGLTTRRFSPFSLFSTLLELDRVKLFLHLFSSLNFSFDWHSRTHLRVNWIRLSRGLTSVTN